MDNHTLSLISQDFKFALKELRIMVLTKQIIKDLDKLNRIRHMQKLPRIDYSPFEVEAMVIGCHGSFSAKQGIIERLIRSSLNGEIR